MYKNMKSMYQKSSWRSLLLVPVILVLTGCVSFSSTYPVTVSTETEQKAIWILDIQFGEYSLIGGGLGGSVGENTGRGRRSVGMGNIKIPKTATFRWKKRAHYTKSKYFPVHEYTVQLPQKMPGFSPGQKVLFLFLIKKDNTVTLEVRPR